MFAKARLTLTGWYVLTIMMICAVFSFAFYKQATFELERGLRRQAFRNLPFIIPGSSPELDIAIYNEIKDRIALGLLLINSGIFAFSAISAYFLSGKTLKPIEIMMEDQKRFVADASHELRTPLTAMKTEIEVALRDKRMSVKQARELINSNLEEVNKMHSLSNYLLSLSRYQNDRTNFTFEKTSFNTIFQKTIEDLKGQANLKHLNVSLEGTNTEARVNQISISELFSILLDNAIKYSKIGGNILIKIRPDQHNANITIKDYGMGIKASDLPFIFNRFYRADSSRTKTIVSGYGLGLSIAKSIADLHNGTISVDSTPGEGSIFTVKIPLNLSAQSQTANLK